MYLIEKILLWYGEAAKRRGCVIPATTDERTAMHPTSGLIARAAAVSSAPLRYVRPTKKRSGVPTL